MATGWATGDTATIRASMFAACGREPMSASELFSRVTEDIGSACSRRLWRALRWLEQHGAVKRVGRKMTPEGGYVRSKRQMSGPHRVLLTYAWGEDCERTLGLAPVPAFGDRVVIRQGNGRRMLHEVVEVTWREDENPVLLTTHVTAYLDPVEDAP